MTRYFDHKSRQLILGLGFALLTCVSPLLARGNPPDSKDQPDRHPWRSITTSDHAVIFTAHSRGNIQLALGNNGTFGTHGETIQDVFTGEPIPSCEYPRNSDIVYIWVGAYWIGAIVGNDTLVSCGSEDSYETYEFWPDSPELGGTFTYGSIDTNSKFYSSDVFAYSEEDIICEYYDTVTNPGLTGRDEKDNRGHVPLNIKVTQRSMAWSYDYADDFVLFDISVLNIGQERLREVFLGIWIDGDAFHVTRKNPEFWTDDIVGFYRTHPAPDCPGHLDTINIAYHCDNDGDPMPFDDPVSWDYMSATSVVGPRVVRTPSDSLNYSFNWWITNYSRPDLDFGPRRQGTSSDPFRNFGTRLGTPIGDCNKYYVMSHKEFDYDLLWTAVNHTQEGWLPPPPDAEHWARGFDCRYLLSFGPFGIEPGQSLPITFAWVGGENFHQQPRDYVDLFDPYHPEIYYSSLNFDGLATNARWASWIYDNPGVDTDGDGDSGNYRICFTGDPGPDSAEGRRDWYEGDGVPDFRGAGPPPAPVVRVIPSTGKLTIRWNGFNSETAEDIFTHLVDFEGYRVYAALDDRPSSFTLLGSYDKENYRQFVWEQDDPEGFWSQEEVPLTLEELREFFNDPLFDPNYHTRANPKKYEGQSYYYEAQDFNQSYLLNPRGIHKRYYNTVPDPGTDPELWTEDDMVYENGEVYPKFYEYEYVYDNLLPTIPYYVAVTTFDFGSPRSGLTSLETKPINNYVLEYAQMPSDSVEANHLDVFVYPNPYRLDANYAARGFENRSRNLAPERARLIHFSNLPKVCTIYIYSLDGDLVRKFKHDYPEGGPCSMHDTWDLITRNTQAVVTGIYYWVVESDTRTQIGKLVIIK